MKPKPSQVMLVLVIYFALGCAAVLVVGMLAGCKPKTDNYNTNCVYTHSDETWDHYECDNNGFRLERINE